VRFGPVYTDITIPLTIPKKIINAMGSAFGNLLSIRLRKVVINAVLLVAKLKKSRLTDVSKKHRQIDQ
jgi:hypothetical protein